MSHLDLEQLNGLIAEQVAGIVRQHFPMIASGAAGFSSQGIGSVQYQNHPGRSFVEEPGGKLSIMKMSTFTGNSKNKSSKKASTNNTNTNQSSDSLSESDESDHNSGAPIKRGVNERVVQETGADKFMMSKESYKLLQKRTSHLLKQNQERTIGVQNSRGGLNTIKE